MTALETRDELRVMVIRAEGRFFTAGIDIALIQGHLNDWTGEVLTGVNLRRDYRRLARHDLLDRIEAVEKPVILAPHGPCVGLGVELGVSCDFRLAADTATFSLPEVPTLGLIPGSGGISRLTRLVGPHWATWIVMGGETISAEKAMAIGLVHEVYAADEFAEKVTGFATRLARMPREALAIAKVAIQASADLDRRTSREFDRMAQNLLVTSPEFRERIQHPEARQELGTNQPTPGSSHNRDPLAPAELAPDRRLRAARTAGHRFRWSGYGPSGCAWRGQQMRYWLWPSAARVRRAKPIAVGLGPRCVSVLHAW